MFHKKSITISAIITLVLTGCVSNQQPQQKSQVTQQNLQLLNEFSEFKKELRFLRSTVEEMQFETENMQRRQKDVFEDFDRRLLALEGRPGEAVAELPEQQARISAGVGTVQPRENAEEVPVLSTNSETVSEKPQEDSVVVVERTPQIDTSQVKPQPAQDSLSVLEEKVYTDAVQKLQQSRYAEAIEGFSRLVEDWPQSELADDSYFYMGEAQYVNRQYEQALNSFRQVERNFPQSARLPDAILKVGMIQFDVGAYNDAKNTFRSLLEQFPEHSSSETARTRLLRIEQIIE